MRKLYTAKITYRKGTVEVELDGESKESVKKELLRFYGSSAKIKHLKEKKKED